MTELKDLKDLPKDIFNLFDPNEDHVCSEDNVKYLTDTVADVVTRRLRKVSEPTSPLRFSALGKPDCMLWFEAHPDGTKEQMTNKTFFKFLYGDLIEAILLFLAKEAGHTVSDEQREVEVDGVKGHIDAIIDGVVVDVKSASPFGYRKFVDRSIFENDPFGYVDQLSGYATVLSSEGVVTDDAPAWVANDKVSGDICVTDIPSTIVKHHNPQERIKHLKEVIASDTPPPRCAQPVADGKSGNMKLVTTPCGYCAHKYRCHPGLRTFLYSNGPRFLTTVAKTPDVPEVERYIEDEG